MKENNTRNYGIDFMRVVLIIFIIIHHILLRGPISLRLLINSEFQNGNVLFLIINAYLVISVNCFFLISGYFGIHRNYKKLIKLCVSVYIIYYIVNLLFLISKGQRVNSELIKGFLFPISQYWFVFVYIVISFIAPYLEVMLKNITITEQKYLILFSVCIWCIYAFLIDNPILGGNRGYSVMFALILYIIGNYLKRKDRTLNTRISIFIFLGSSLFNGLLAIGAVFMGKQSLAWQLFSYNNPLVLIGAISFFCLFLHLEGCIVYRLSKFGKYAIYIYIYHSTPILANWYMQLITEICGNDKLKFVGVSILTTMLLFLSGMLVGILYEILWSSIIGKFNRLPVFKNKKG